MALVNALLVRYATGYVWVEDAGSIATHDRREGFLTLGAASSLSEAERTGAAILAQRLDPEVGVSVAMEVNGGVEPFVDFAVADWITVPDEDGTPASMRVMAVTVTEDEEGNPIYVPELRTLAQEQEQRIARWLKRMTNGTLGGTVESASPAPYVGPGLSSDPTGSSASGGVGSPTVRQVAILFQQGGAEDSPLTTGRSADVPSPAAQELVSVTASATTTGSVNAAFEVFADGVSAGTVTLTVGSTEVTATLSASPLAGLTGKIAVECTNAGTGWEGVAVLVLGRATI